MIGAWLAAPTSCAVAGAGLAAAGVSRCKGPRRQAALEGQTRLP